MTAHVFKLTTAATTNLTKIKDGPANLKGLVAVNTAATAIFVKFYFYRATPAVPVPVVGTTVPSLTLQIPATASITPSFPDGMSSAGELWVAVTLLAPNTDATAVAAGDGLISVLYE